MMQSRKLSVLSVMAVSAMIAAAALFSMRLVQAQPVLKDFR